jgi:hypothetical protein
MGDEKAVVNPPAAGANQLFHADGKPAGIWYCSECRSVNSDERTAQSCHGITHCEKCGKELGKRQPYYRVLCEECDRAQWRDRLAKEEFERYTKATKIRASEYTGPQVFFNDHYYESVEDAIDGCDIPPEYVWAAKDIGLRKACIDDLTERVLEEAWDDADIDDLNGVEELQKAVDAFNEANAGISVYMVDYHEALVLDDEILAEWRTENANSVLTGPTDGEAKTER